MCRKCQCVRPEAPLPVVTMAAAAVYREAEDDLSERRHVTLPAVFLFQLNELVVGDWKKTSD